LILTIKFYANLSVTLCETSFCSTTFNEFGLFHLTKIVMLRSQLCLCVCVCVSVSVSVYTHTYTNKKSGLISFTIHKMTRRIMDFCT